MRGLASVRPGDAPRLRRWDAIVLGGALPGLVAAVRLGQRGARVLVIEERAARDAFFGLREPFALTGADPRGVLGICLRELALPLIERRRLVPAEIAVQIATSDARIDLGDAALALAELTSWGLAKSKPGRELLEACEQAAREERESLLTAPFVRGVRRRWTRAAAAPVPERAFPPPVPELPGSLRPVFEGLASVLCGGAPGEPSDATIARRVGSLLLGVANLRREEGGLRGLLRRRSEALLAEFRSSVAPPELLSVGGQPAVGLSDPSETCAARLLLLNAPRASLAAAGGRRLPPALRAPEPTHQRVALHYRGEARALPEGMRERVIHVSRPDEADARARVALQVFSGEEAGPVDLVASTVAPAGAAGAAAAEDWIRRSVRRLAPFSQGSLEPVADPRPLWDLDAVGGRPDTPRWLRGIDLRLSQRPPIYALPREAVSPLGLDGDLLLGWRAGDVLADALA